jgi:hypothetical protein
MLSLNCFPFCGCPELLCVLGASGVGSPQAPYNKITGGEGARAA